MFSWKPIRGTNLTNKVEVCGRIAFDAANADVISEGKGFTAARTGVGVHTITMAPDLPGFEFKGARLQYSANAAVDLVPQSGGYVSSTGVFTYRLLAAAAATEAPAANANNWLYFELVFGSTVE